MNGAALRDERRAQIILQKRMLDADTPRRLLAIAASGLVGLLYLSPLQTAMFLGLYFPCDLALIAALRLLERQPQARWRLRLVQGAAFFNMAAYLVPAVMLWLEPGTAPKLGATLFVFGGMLSVMLVRSALLPMTIANCLPLLGFVVVISIIERPLATGREALFMGASVSLLAVYFLMTLRSTLRINRTLAEARDAALARVATQRRFLTTMSHELRTPLNGILGMAQSMIARHPGLGAEVIRDSARDMAAMVGDLLDNAAIEAGALRINPVPVELATLLQRIDERWQPAFAAKRLTLTIAHDDALPPRLMLDPLRITQCLSNLLANALRHTMTGGVLLELRPHALGLVVTVTDTGPGLPMGMEEQLFQPFVALTAEIQDAGPSTGLGLSICRGLARVMGGDLTFERPAEGGSRFSLTVRAPRAMAGKVSGAVPAASASSDPVDVSTPDPALDGLRVLVVDDIATNRLVLRLILTELGVAVAEATSGEAALQMLSARPVADFDAVLMDIRMPGLSGYQTLAQMRQQGFGGYVMAISADVAPEKRAEALACGFDGYLTKPVEADRLLALLRNARTTTATGL